MSPLFVPICLLSLAPLAAPAELVVADFEGKDYGAFKASGAAFGSAPARGTLPNQMTVSGYLGEGLVNSFLGGDDAEGELVLAELKIEKPRVNFLVGGGSHPGLTAIQLVVDGKIIHSTTGANSETLRWASWNVQDLVGKTARLEIIDRKKGSWGHICVDQIVQSDEAPVIVDDRDGLLARAEASVKAAAAKVEKDPQRPTFHVLPPAYWMNDPNGPVFWKGWYHLFYQHNPYGDEWGNMHWGHVRSKDLVRWEHQPIALWPSKSLGEDHVFSGAATVTRKGQLLLFYTSIGPRLPEQWAAIPEDDELVRWKKHPANPILTEALHGATKVHEWRDPFPFRDGDGDYMVCGGNLNASAGGQGIVNVYQAETEDMSRWRYRGVLFQHPDPSVKNVECPLFFKVRDRWVLVVSQGTPVEYFTGDLDSKEMRFKATYRGVMDWGQYYAPNAMEDPQGRRILWGWVNGFPAGRGWRHAMTVPRLLTVRQDGSLAQQPLPELTGLRRGPERRYRLTKVVDRSNPLRGLSGVALDLEGSVDLGGTRVFGLRVRESSDGTRAVEIRYEAGHLTVGGIKATVPVGEDQHLDLRVLLDHSLLEVYANGVCVSKVIEADPGDQGASVFTEGGAPQILFHVWQVDSIWDRK